VIDRDVHVIPEAVSTSWVLKHINCDGSRLSEVISDYLQQPDKQNKRVAFSKSQTFYFSACSCLASFHSSRHLLRRSRSPSPSLLNTISSAQPPSDLVRLPHSSDSAPMALPVVVTMDQGLRMPGYHATHHL